MHLQPPFNDAFCVRKYSNMPNDVRKKMLIVIYTVYLHAEKQTRKSFIKCRHATKPLFNDAFCVRNV